MSKQPFSTSPSYVQSIQGLRRLHELTVNGKDESPEAEAIRDSLYRPWGELSEIERKRITGLSEDLYSISDPPKEQIPANREAHQGLSEAYEALKNGEWDKALELFRCWRRYLPPDRLSSLRGFIWKEAGDDETARLFYGHAEQLPST